MLDATESLDVCRTTRLATAEIIQGNGQESVTPHDKTIHTAARSANYSFPGLRRREPCVTGDFKHRLYSFLLYDERPQKVRRSEGISSEPCAY